MLKIVELEPKNMTSLLKIKNSYLNALHGLKIVTGKSETFQFTQSGLFSRNP